MKPIKLMINGLPGKVTETIVRHAANDERFLLIPYSLTGPDISPDTHTVENRTFTLVKPGNRSTVIQDIIQKEGAFISIDYTHPTAVNANVEFYCNHNLPFVMGTTGGDRDAIPSRIQSSSISAVVAPNMVKQIVGLMAMLEYAANTFPGLFNGYTMNVAESHQSWKADTSGTAKAMIGYFNKLGVPFSEDDICMVRDPDVQKNQWNIPEQYLDGHGWHTYTLDSSDKTARFAITHNISGRDVYVEGTLDAAIYLQKKLSEGMKGTVFSMIDVLKNL